MYRNDKIRGRQAELGWSNEDLAVKADVNVNTISAIRNGKTVRTDTLQKVTAALDLTMAEVFEPKPETANA
jgi:transcriptional regulator with XRE-family HTH domain